MELDVAALQEARRKPGRGCMRAASHAITDLYPEPVRPVRPGTWLPAIVRPRSKIYLPKEVRVGYGAEIAVLWRITTAADARLQVSCNFVTADVQPSDHAGRIMVHHVHVAEEPAVLAS